MTMTIVCTAPTEERLVSSANISAFDHEIVELALEDSNATFGQQGISTPMLNHILLKCLQEQQLHWDDDDSSIGSLAPEDYGFDILDCQEGEEEAFDAAFEEDSIVLRQSRVNRRISSPEDPILVIAALDQSNEAEGQAVRSADDNRIPDCIDYEVSVKFE